MPFTPFHMGPGLAIKSVAPRHVSILVFGVSQVCIDVEPLVHMIRGDAVLHGFTHTIGGAIVIGAVATVLGRLFANLVLPLLEADPPTDFLDWLRGTPTVSRGSAALSAFLGTFSHLLLDGIMHGDMHPFAPLTPANPLLGSVGLGVLHLGCVALGLLGIAGLGLHFLFRQRG